MGKQFANRLALLSFSVVLLRSLIQGTDFTGSMQIALVCLCAFYMIGYLIGDLAQRMIEEHVEVEEAQLLAGIAAVNSQQSP